MYTIDTKPNKRIKKKLKKDRFKAQLASNKNKYEIKKIKELRKQLRALKQMNLIFIILIILYLL